MCLWKCKYKDKSGINKGRAWTYENVKTNNKTKPYCDDFKW